MKQPYANSYGFELVKVNPAVRLYPDHPVGGHVSASRLRERLLTDNRHLRQWATPPKAVSVLTVNSAEMLQ